MRKMTVSIMALCVMLVLPGCDKAYRMLQREGAEELDLIGDIKPFEKNERVAMVQQRLKIFGYGIGTVDGVLGVNTRNAVERFQKDNGLAPNRFIDSATWKLIMVFDECGLIMEDDINLFMVQVALKNAGYDVGSVDGKMGRRSTEMLQKFQGREGLVADGKIGWKTLSALARYLPVTDKKM